MLAETLSRHKNHTKHSSKSAIPKLNIMPKKNNLHCKYDETKFQKKVSKNKLLE